MRKMCYTNFSMRFDKVKRKTEAESRMINNRKVRLMTQLAIYEKGEGKKDFKLAKYYKTDYARFNVLKTALAVTVSYAILCVFFALYKLQYILDNILTIDYKQIGWTALGIYLGLMSFYLIVTLLGYSIKYSLSRKKLSKYYRMLRKLKELYNEEDAYAEGTLPDDYDEDEGEDAVL